MKHPTAQHDALRRRRRGCGTLRHRGRPLPADRMSLGRLRHLRGARRDRRNMGPFPLPGHPLRLRHAHARATRSGPGTARSPSPTATRSSSTSKTQRQSPASTRHIRFRHRSSPPTGRRADSLWHITAERTDTNETIHLTAGFLFSCSGYYRYDHGYLPDFAGMDDFDGPIVHPQAWPEDLDVAGKRVVVIGSGATAVTLVPALAQSAAHVTMLQRSPSYIASLPENSPVAAPVAQGPAAETGRERPRSGSTPC